MNYKEFGIVTLILSAVIVVICFILNFIKTDSPLNIKTPAYFNIYNHSSTAKKITKENDPENFKRLESEVRAMTNLSIFSRLAHGGQLDEMPSQTQGNDEYGYFSDNEKKDNICIELVFNEVQKQIIQIDGNTKMIEYYRMFFVVKNGETHILPIYLDRTESNIYASLPITVRVNTCSLYDACKNSLSKND